MRIIGGIYRSRPIKRPKGIKVRPTQDRVREAVFNVMADNVIDSDILELYAGSGAFGIEAISRGATKAIFVDINSQCTKVILDNLKKLNVPGDKVAVFKSDAIKAIKKLSSNKQKFDIIFVDPPYKEDIVKNCLINIIKYDILAPTGLLVVEHHKDERLSHEEMGLLLKKQKKYRNTVISIYMRIL